MALAFTSIGALIAETVNPESRGLTMGGYSTLYILGNDVQFGIHRGCYSSHRL
jgi:hypothetical protein